MASRAADNERPVRLRPARPARPRDESHAWSKAFKGLMHIVRMTSRLKGGTPTPAAAPRRHARRQRCAVRITYSRNRTRGQWSAHGRYIARESAVPTESTTKAGFTAREDGIDIAATLGDWQKAGDQRLFKIIVSPEFGERMDLRHHTRELMSRMAEDLGAGLEWVAVAHFNTQHSHVHIGLRGVSDGKSLRIPQEYVKHGLRQQAETLCTTQLGFRTELDALEAERREIDQPRPTSLDHTIARLGTACGTEDLEVATEQLVRFHPVRQHYLSARLHSLETMGLAQRVDASKWTVRPDFQSVLRSMKKATDRQKMLAAHASLLSDTVSL
jgi:type IV secretory pathway VirD2 relaxase